MNSSGIKKVKNCEYSLLVGMSLIEKLNRLLNDCTNVKMGELKAKFVARYDRHLEIFTTEDNNVVIQLESSSKTTGKNLQSSGLEWLLKKLDVADLLASEVSDRKIPKAELENYASLKFELKISEGRVQKFKIHEKKGQTKYIPDFLDKIEWQHKKIYTGCVTNIYDPSKFWMRFAEVDTLQKHLWEFYQEKKDDFSFSQWEITIGSNCVAFVGGQYQRGRIVRSDIQEPNNFIIFLLDHGSIHRLHLEKLFKLHEKFLVIPALAVRCRLTNISPLEDESWTEEAVEKFAMVTRDEKELAVKVVFLDVECKVLEVYLVDPSIEKDGRCPTINNYLVQMKVAKIFWHHSNKPAEDRVYKPLRKFMYLYPLHEMIENGTAPSTLALTEKLKECVAWDVLFPGFYKYEPQ